MSAGTGPVSAPMPGELTPVKRALLEIRELRKRLAELESAAREPVAIVGIGVRAPGGVRDTSSYADLLWAGRDAISPIPATRWPIDEWYDPAQDAPGKMITRFGGFIEDVEQFDAEFFGISPREAASMDPQQRLVLELAWNALEDSGHSPVRLAGTLAGVYLGIANGDYGRALFAHPQQIDPYFSSGNAYSVAAGRVSYLLGLQGPAIAVDTACSSSLVALHLACQGLRQGECDLALAGGINLILTPEMNVNFSKAGMMARDGRCKTFDEAADGYVRGEGGAIVVLRRLRDAQADGDRILAVIRGSAVNQDGRSNGLTAPNGPAQEAVIRAALRAANLTPREVGYIEAHGTGTSLGDPIEVNALAAVFGEDRDPSRPLSIGSVKTNFGHLEAAAGIVGLIKAALVLQRGEIPPHLHLHSLNSHIPWSAIPIVVPTATTRLETRVAGVSSFGFSGTNAHVILEAAPVAVRAAAPRSQRDTHVLAISARDPRALDALVAAHVQRLAAMSADTDLGDYCFTANAGRAHLAHRVSVIGTSGSAMAAALEAFRRGEPHPDVVSGTVGEAPPRVAMLFPGQGSQYAGMGRELYDGAPAFRQAFDRCAEVLDPLLPEPIHSIVFGAGADAALLNETACAQPAIYAIEVALASLWRSWGIDPVAVLGHSFGEYAAACVAGALSLADGARIVAARGRLVQALAHNGAMTVISASEAAVNERLRSYQNRAAIAAVNGPTNTVISGERAAVETLSAEFAAAGARVTPLRISHAFHSPLMDPVLDEFEREVAKVEWADPHTVLISNLSGRVADLELIGKPRYWRRHMREAVRFADSIRALAARGITHYIEIGPHPVLVGMGSECVQGGAWLPSLREGKAAWPVMLHALQALYCAGASVDWEAVDRDMGRRRVAVPGYPFQRKRHWADGIGVGVPTAGASGQERWQRLNQALDSQAKRGPLDLNVATYPRKWDCLARINRGYAVQIFRAAGLFTKPFERHSLDQVLTRTGISGAYRHLVSQWLERLTAAGLVRRDADTYVADAPLPDPNLPSLWREAEDLFGDNQPLLAYVRHCGKLLGAVLTGKESPLETLFPGGSFELADGLYQRSATMRYLNGLASSAIEAFASGTAPGSSLRIMEVGAGTGGTTSSLLPVLPPDRVRYRFTDVSNTFFEQARKRFATFRFVDYGLFDVDMEPTAQGYEPQSFDLVVSANAVHACTDLRAALRHLHSLIAPGGLLVLVESTIHHDWFDMTTGLIEGWKRFADDLRTDNPLLSASAWMAALRDEGFVETNAWPPSGSPAEVLGVHVIVGRVAGSLQASAATAARAEDNRPEVDSPASQPWRELLDRSLPGERLSVLQEMVCEQVMQVLGASAASRPARHDRLMDLGMDSLMAVQLRNRLTTALALDPPLPSTLMFDYPTINAIANNLLERLTPMQPSTRSGEMTRAQTPAVRSAAAIAAMSDEEIAKLL